MEMMRDTDTPPTLQMILVLVLGVLIYPSSWRLAFPEPPIDDYVRERIQEH